MIRPFIQSPPVLGNQYRDDRVLRSYLKRTLPPDVYREVEPSLDELGELSGGDLYRRQLAGRNDEPVLTQWDAWGERVDRIELTSLWQHAERLAAQFGVVAAAYEKRYGPYDRTYQFALAYLFHPSTDIYTCPLAMTDGAASTLLRSGNHGLIERAVPHLTSRDPASFWTSGQWMTESTGGSDVGRSETIAHYDGPDGSRDTIVDSRRGGPSAPSLGVSSPQGTVAAPWRLYGRKWFTSAATSQIALALARPEGNPPGGRGLALFYVETHDEAGRPYNIWVNRLKDKLGTRKLPTAELTLDGTPAQLVYGTANGVAHIVPMLHLTRTWNSVTAVAAMRRGLALARSYARTREAFGAPLSEKPLHVDTLAGLQAEMEAAFHLAFYLASLIGRDEAGESTPAEEDLLRLLTSVVKLTTGRQVVEVVSEVIEAFGGAGYVEDTGLAGLMRDSHIFPIWEGTTNVLSLDVLKALSRDGGALPALAERMQRAVAATSESGLAAAGLTALRAFEHAVDWVRRRAGPLAPSLRAAPSLRVAPSLQVSSPSGTVAARSAGRTGAAAGGETVPTTISDTSRTPLSETLQSAATPRREFDPELALEAGARRFAMTLGRSLALALLVEHAQWALDHESDGRPRAAALRFAVTRIDLIAGADLAGAFDLMDDA